MFELSPEAINYIVKLVRLRLDIPEEKVSDEKIHELFNEIIAFVKGQFGL